MTICVFVLNSYLCVDKCYNLIIFNDNDFTLTNNKKSGQRRPGQNVRVQNGSNNTLKRKVGFIDKLEKGAPTKIPTIYIKVFCIQYNYNFLYDYFKLYNCVYIILF